MQPIVKHRVSFHVSIRFYQIALRYSTAVSGTSSAAILQKCFGEGERRGILSRNPAIILLLQQRCQSKRTVPLSIDRNSSVPFHLSKSSENGWMMVFQRRYFSLLRISLTPVSPLACKCYCYSLIRFTEINSSI